MNDFGQVLAPDKAEAHSYQRSRHPLIVWLGCVIEYSWLTFPLALLSEYRRYLTGGGLNISQSEVEARLARGEQPSEQRRPK